MEMRQGGHVDRRGRRKVIGKISGDKKNVGVEVYRTQW
jgi:hypothetical protein